MISEGKGLGGGGVESGLPEEGWGPAGLAGPLQAWPEGDFFPVVALAK